MKSASSSLIAIMASGTAHLQQLLAITTLDGTVYRVTDGLQALTYGGHVYSATSILFERDTITTKRGLEVQTLNLTLYAPPSVEANGIPFMQAVLNGYLDGATILLQRMFNFSEVLYLFSGRVADVTVSRYAAQVTVKSWLELLDAPMPRNHIQSACPNTLFDTACGLVQATYEHTETCNAGCDTSHLYFTAAGLSVGYYNLGRLVFTYGANTGARRVIRSHTQPGGAQLVEMLTPLPFVPAEGDSFTIIPGCDKTLSTCQNKFLADNTARFRGCPFMPDPTVAL